MLNIILKVFIQAYKIFFRELQEEKHEEREVVKSASIKRRGAGWVYLYNWNEINLNDSQFDMSWLKWSKRSEKSYYVQLSNFCIFLCPIGPLCFSVCVSVYSFVQSNCQYVCFSVFSASGKGQIFQILMSNKIFHLNFMVHWT